MNLGYVMNKPFLCISHIESHLDKSDTLHFHSIVIGCPLKNPSEQSVFHAASLVNIRGVPPSHPKPQPKTS